MSQSTTMKEAVKQWESKNEQKINQAVEIKLNGILPPLDKMDTSVLSFHHCEKLSLSSNCIERIANLSSLKRLRILSLGRNNIKSISGLEAVGETLEELWISHNPIEKLKGIGAMKKLRVLNMSNNNVREWIEFARLAEVLTLKDVVFMGNPLEEKCSLEGTWRSDVARRLPNLNKLDGYQLTECDLPVEESNTGDGEEEEEEIEAEAMPKSKFDAVDADEQQEEGGATEEVEEFTTQQQEEETEEGRKEEEVEEEEEEYLNVEIQEIQQLDE